MRALCACSRSWKACFRTTKARDLPGLSSNAFGLLPAPVRLDVVAVVALVGALLLVGDAAAMGLDVVVQVVELLRRLLEPLFIRHNSLLPEGSR